MLYTLLHWWLGWDYIQWKNSADSGVARVFKLHNGKVVYWRYKVTKVMDEIKDIDQVRWLTCDPSKYFNKGHSPM